MRFKDSCSFTCLHRSSIVTSHRVHAEARVETSDFAYMCTMQRLSHPKVQAHGSFCGDGTTGGTTVANSADSGTTGAAVRALAQPPPLVRQALVVNVETGTIGAGIKGRVAAHLLLRALLLLAM